MAITEDNSKIVIFGGRVPLAPNSTSSSESTFSEELFVLDIATSSWKKGPNAAIKRGYTACIIVGDQFLAWGGYNDNLVVSGPPIVFDLTKFEWANTYTAPIYNQTHQTQTQTITGSQTPSSTQSQPTQTGEPSATNKEAIIGGSVGALALIVIIAGLIIYKRWRRGKSQGYSVPEEKGFNQYDDSCAPEYLRNSMTEHVYYNSNPTRGPQLMTRRNPQEMTPMTLYQGQIPQESFVANVTHGTQL
ncbi:hypothetical protein BCR41DRAFT_11584 [Lobosporangium transversale]|uniref:Galactose oxidase n=1 Tax=Lobosporangium transversale TaxID=64571 RepID=A0A1Y2H5Y5_9FUNG|nr:hypothetical protein BCR41DRAFT_11584 [Lobosporangium transversale]ORZ29113.1 hypothetical protein BCR41DRAFT_11584 [Lobosporangium transversale]|eukprot:XP_021886786.1 hypothetical protein BCR41DRAFT_11584 [Lobosporangium transversale]